jgi:hypothetical protein
MINILAPMFFMLTADVRVVNLVDNVGLGGLGVLTIRTLEPSERVNRVYERLAEVLEPGLTANDISAKPGKGFVSILVKDKLVYTVTVADAKANKSKLDDYAAKVLQHLKNVLPELAPVK